MLRHQDVCFATSSLITSPMACLSLAALSSLHVEETLSTLSYATRAKNIQNRPVVQYDPKEQQIASLRREIDLLRQVCVWRLDVCDVRIRLFPHCCCYTVTAINRKPSELALFVFSVKSWQFCHRRMRT